MKNKPVKIGNAQGFWGDTPTAPLCLVEQIRDLDFLTLDYLSELSMSILAIQREKDPEKGYAADFIDVIKSIAPFWKLGHPVKIISNAGGLNPIACVKECRKVLDSLGLYDMKVGAVTGDSVIEQMKQDSSNSSYCNLETKASLESVVKNLVTANAYVGAEPIVELLKEGVSIIVTGRIADPSMAVAPAIYYHGWSYDDYDKVAQATVAGHLIECGTQVTGGILSSNWLSIEDPANIGFPYVEISADSSFVITKSPKSSGVVNYQTVKEQLLYEIGDPEAYLSPDATVSFLNLHLAGDGKDRIKITGAIGKAPTCFYKVSATYKAGFKAEGMLVIFGQNAVLKAKQCGAMILKRVQMAGFTIERSCIECLGAGDSVGRQTSYSDELLECVLRVAVADKRKEAVEAFTKEIAPLVTSGPQGVTGYTSGRPKARPQFGYWPCLIEREKVEIVQQIM